MSVFRLSLVCGIVLLPLTLSAEINRLQLGAHLDSNNVTFRVYSSRATRLEVDLFRQGSKEDEVARLPLTKDASTSVWSVAVPLTTIKTQFGITGAIYYGFRAWGPNWNFDAGWTKGSQAGFVADVDGDGNRFNPNKLLLDPYAREISQDPANPDNLDGSVYASGPVHRLQDTGRVAAKGIVLPDLPATATHANSTLQNDIIYEVNLRGLTELDASVPAALRGTYKGAALKAKNLKSLGVTAVEFLPIQETQNDDNDAHPGQANYWGYATLNYFAPDRRYSSDKSPGGPTREVQAMIQAYHQAGLKVFADVVYNHTGEGDAYPGPDGKPLKDTANVISWRGLDNPTYYLLVADHQFSFDNTGTGGDYNTVNPVAQDLIADSLAYWLNVLGVDGFRFDLASVLGNTCSENCFHFDKLAPETALNRIAREFPGVPLIAEPWAASGDNNYQLGNFPAGWSDWNDQFRDGIRKSQNKLGVEPVTTGELATRFSGSSDLFQNNGRKPWNSINFLVAHDGFTLADLYRFNQKNNNQPFPAGPSDGGRDNNESWDQNGDHVEQLKAARTGFALLMLSAGTPMMTGGDEFLRSLNGNNNPYNLDTPFNYLNYSLIQEQSAFEHFAKSVLAFRREHPALHPAEFYTPEQLTWFRPDGGPADANYFGNADNHAIARLLNGTSLGDPSSAIYIAYNGWSADVQFRLPSAGEGKSWIRAFDTSLTSGPRRTAVSGSTYVLPSRSVLVLVAR